jgi:hypothetical protein
LLLLLNDHQALPVLSVLLGQLPVPILVEEQGLMALLFWK